MSSTAHACATVGSRASGAPLKTTVSSPRTAATRAAASAASCSTERTERRSTPAPTRTPLLAERWCTS